ncbi:MAG: hypothetical protein JWP87_4774 [Labilithrix sp.]|nr:hypothetical protein [Labilithrix sp.]
MFERVGNMTLSKSSLDRLPRRCRSSGKPIAKQFEETLRASLQIPAEATTVAASLDRVLSPFEGAQPVESELAGMGETVAESVAAAELAAFCALAPTCASSRSPIPAATTGSSFRASFRRRSAPASSKLRARDWSRRA